MAYLHKKFKRYAAAKGGEKDGSCPPTALKHSVGSLVSDSGGPAAEKRLLDEEARETDSPLPASFKNTLHRKICVWKIFLLLFQAFSINFTI